MQPVADSTPGPALMAGSQVRPFLEIEALNVAFDGTPVLRGIDFAVRRSDRYRRRVGQR